MCHDPIYIISFVDAERAFPLLRSYFNRTFVKSRVSRDTGVKSYFAMFKMSELAQDMYEKFEILSSMDKPFVFKVPCRKCLGCLSDRRNQWLNRCLIEARQYKSNLFVTWTYNEEHVPPCLIRKDYQDSFKRLRIALDRLGRPKIREYYCGEYGDRFSRPHFHSIVFNMDLPYDVEVRFWLSKNGRKIYHAEIGATPYYSSKWLESIWKNGFCIIAPVCKESIKYVANYLDKGKAPVAYPNAKPFKGMSCRPAIGRQYFDSIVSKNGLEGLLEAYNGTIKLGSVHYYRRLVKEMDPDVYSDFIEWQRRISMAQKKPWFELGITEYEYLQRLEEKARSALQKFGRKKQFECSS